MIKLKGACGSTVFINKIDIVSVTCKNLYGEKRTFVRTIRGDFFVYDSVDDFLSLLKEDDHSKNCGCSNCRTLIQDNPRRVHRSIQRPESFTGLPE